MNAKEIIAECQQGSMTEGRLNQMMQSLYDSGVNSQLAITRKINRFHRRRSDRIVKETVDCRINAEQDVILNAASDIALRLSDIAKNHSETIIKLLKNTLDSYGVKLSEEDEDKFRFAPSYKEVIAIVSNLDIEIYAKVKQITMFDDPA